MATQPELAYEDSGRAMIEHVQRSLEMEQDFYFSRLESLHRLNIVNLQVKLERMKHQFQKAQGASEGELEDLSASLRAYTSAIRDYEFLRSHNPLGRDETAAQRLRFQRLFRFPLDSESDAWHYYSYRHHDHDHERRHQQQQQHPPDPLRQFFMRRFPRQLSFSAHEKKERRKEYLEGESPIQVSPAVDTAARFIIALAGGAFVVVPMIIMSIDQTLDTSLITVSSAIVIFALLVSMGIRVSNFETLVATATYAAVLVVFVVLRLGVMEKHEI
ncbi:hypothetical protein QBC43DRAFT_353395 [Cladorrhinum sp. PSN259]|nr:hypothetical protein QBC43DRAFT_353395 [Cladorrhinum sp. PSN259]